MAKSAISIKGPLIKTGIFAVATSLVLGFVSIELGGFRFYDTGDYKANFTNATSLIEGDPVMVNGVRVGKVSGVSVHENTQAQVSFSVKDTVPLPADTEAVVRYRNLTGDRYLELVPTAGDGDGDGGGELEAGATIPLERTRPALDLDVLLGGLQPLFEGLDDEQINRLSAELVAVLQGEGGTVESILAQTASFSSTLAERDEVIGQTIDNLNSVLGTLDTHSQDLSETISGLDTLATGLSADRARLGSSFDRVDQLTTSVEGLLADLRGPFQNFVNETGRLTSVINSQRDTFDEILGKLPGFYLRIGRLGSRGPGYNLYICDLRVRLTDPVTGQEMFTPWIGPSPDIKSCQPGVAPGETEEQLQEKLAAERGQTNEGGE